MTDYKVSLDVYNGPLDLLLFLIRREEIDIYDIPIARITAQYIEYVERLKQLDPEVVSEFLVLAATLMETKSRTLLPRPPALEEDEEIADPRLELVRQLLEYKKYKDVAYSLEEAADEQALKYARHPVQPPNPENETELESLEIWDLFDAFNKLLEQTGRRTAVHKVETDDTPIALHAEDIVDSIERVGGEQPFADIFAGRSRAEMIGLFLALLELIRQHRVKASQEKPFAPILIVLLDTSPLDEIEETPIEEPADEEVAAAETPAGDPEREDDADEPTSDASAQSELENWASPPSRPPSVDEGAVAPASHDAPVQDDSVESTLTHVRNVEEANETPGNAGDQSDHANETDEADANSNDDVACLEVDDDTE